MGRKKQKADDYWEGEENQKELEAIQQQYDQRSARKPALERVETDEEPLVEQSTAEATAAATRKSTSTKTKDKSREQPDKPANEPADEPADEEELEEETADDSELADYTYGQMNEARKKAGLWLAAQPRDKLPASLTGLRADLQQFCTFDTLLIEPAIGTLLQSGVVQMEKKSEKVGYALQKTASNKFAALRRHNSKAVQEAIDRCVEFLQKSPKAQLPDSKTALVEALYDRCEAKITIPVDDLIEELENAKLLEVSEEKVFFKDEGVKKIQKKSKKESNKALLLLVLVLMMLIASFLRF